MASFSRAGIRADESAASPSRASVFAQWIVCMGRYWTHMQRGRLCIVFAMPSPTVAGSSIVWPAPVRAACYFPF